MKIDRLMGILTVLLRSPGVTAPELAERFEVSRRTITRDMEALCRAGVPVVSRQGAGGGFSVQPGYCVPDDLFTRQELRTLLAAAQGVDSLSGGENAARLRSRVPEGEADWIEIDLAGQSPRIKQLFPQLRDAILAESCARIAYCGREILPSGAAAREVNEKGEIPLLFRLDFRVFPVICFCFRSAGTEATGLFSRICKLSVHRKPRIFFLGFRTERRGSRVFRSRCAFAIPRIIRG